MPTYRNRSSGRRVSYGQPNARLDGLPDRWERLDDEDDDQGAGPAETAAKAAEAAADAAQHAADAAEQSAGGEAETREQVEAAAGDNGASTDTGRVPEPVEQPEQHAEPLPERPAKSANRAVWADYAVKLGHDGEQLAELTKAQIVALIDRTPAPGA